MIFSGPSASLITGMRMPPKSNIENRKAHGPHYRADRCRKADTGRWAYRSLPAVRSNKRFAWIFWSIVFKAFVQQQFTYPIDFRCNLVCHWQMVSHCVGCSPPNFPRVDLRLCKLPASEIAGNGTYNDLMPRIFLSLKIYFTIYCVFAIIALDELAEPLRGLV